MKEGLVFIDKRNSQWRYSTGTNDTNKNGHIKNDEFEQIVQPVSIYYAAEYIRRGQPVSPSLYEDLDKNLLTEGDLSDHKQDDKPYVSLTNTAKHKKCIGLALEPAEPGQAIHIQPFGKFTYDATSYSKSRGSNVINQTDGLLEYYPNFGFNLSSDEFTNPLDPTNQRNMYKSLIGKPVFVKSIRYNESQDSVLDSDGQFVFGELTVDEKETYFGNRNIIQVGVITDAPNNIGAKCPNITIEIQPQGDGRGPIDSTQWELTIGEDISISSKEQIKVLAIGSDSGSKFTSYITSTAPTFEKKFNIHDFIALQKMDGKTCFITFKPGVDTFEKLYNGVSSYGNSDDKSFLNIAKDYASKLKELNSDLTFDDLIKVININTIESIPNIEKAGTTNKETYNYVPLYRSVDKDIGEDLSKNLDFIFGKLKESFEFVSSENNTLRKEENTLVKNNKSVDINERTYSAFTKIEATIDEGYFELYISNDLRSDYFEGSYISDNGSFDNKGKAVIADIRIGNRQNIAGLYFNGMYPITFKKGNDVLALHMGQFTIDTSFENHPVFIPGATYYLGTSGNISTYPIEWTDYSLKIGVAKDEYTLMVDCNDCRMYDSGSMPVGFMKPTINNNVDYGFLLMDGGESKPENKVLTESTEIIDEESNESIQCDLITTTSLESIKDENNNNIDKFSRYKVSEYKLLFERLRGLFSESELGLKSNLTYTYNIEYKYVKDENIIKVNTETKDVFVEEETFIVPKYVYTSNGTKNNGSFAQIKWLEEGIFSQIPRVPFKRVIGTFESDNRLSKALNFEKVIDISDLVHYGPRGNSIDQSELDDFDIHLYVDLNSKNKDIDNYIPYWVEIEQGYKLFNNTTMYGYRWRIESENVQTLNSSDPFIKFYLTADVCSYNTEDGQKIDGLGIAVQENPFEPPLLCYGLNWKIYIGRHIYTDRYVDMGALFNNSTSHVLIDPISSKPVSSAVSGQAVYDFFTSKTTFNDLEISSNLLIGKNNSPATLEVYTNDSKFTGPVSFIDNKNGQTAFTVNGSNVEISDPISFNKVDDLIKSEEINRVVTVSTLQNIFNSELNEQTIFGIKNTGDSDGKINAFTLNNIRLGKAINQDLDDVSISALKNSKSFIPFVDATNDESILSIGNSQLFNLGEENNSVGSLKHSYSKDDNVITDTINYLYNNKKENKSGSSQKSIKINYNFDTSNEAELYDIKFTKQIENESEIPANVVFAGLTSASSIKFKNLYNTNIRDYDDIDVSLSKENFENILLRGEEKDENKGTLESALQAAYELPLGLWSYKQDPSWAKRYLGIIIEQVGHVKNNINETHDRFIIDDETKELEENDPYFYKDNKFNYTSNQILSIKSYLDLLTDNGEKGQNIISSIGMLFSAARETQERLLKLEASTFGRDAESIPGNNIEIKQNIEEGLSTEEINQKPSYIGLNRIIKALCKEVFNTFDPTRSEQLSPKTGSYSAKIQDLYTQIEGTNGGHNELDGYKKGNVLNPLNESTDWYSNSDYYADEKNLNDNERNIEIAAQSNTYPSDIKLEINTSNDTKIPEDLGHQGEFNGLNDAVNRIVQKLNVLTAEVNGADNINAGPVRLNLLRENLKTSLNELYFNKYNDEYINNEKTELFIPRSRSRIDMIEEVLFNNKNVISNGDNRDYTKEYGFVPKTEDEYSNNSYKTIIDLLIASIGDLFPLRNINLKDMSTNEQRLRKTISERLVSIENALDNSVYLLLGTSSDKDYNELNEKPFNYNIVDFIKKTSEFIGLSYKNGQWIYAEDNNTDKNISEKKNTYSIISDVINRLKIIENTVDKTINVMGDYYKDSNRNLTTDLKSISQSLFNTDNISDVINNSNEYDKSDNILNSMMNVLYNTSPFNSEDKDQTIDYESIHNKYIIKDNKYNYDNLIETLSISYKKISYYSKEYDLPNQGDLLLQALIENNDFNPKIYVLEKNN